MQSSENKPKRPRKTMDKPQAAPAPVAGDSSEESTKPRRTATPKKSLAEPTSSVKHRGSAKKAVVPKVTPVFVSSASSKTEDDATSLPTGSLFSRSQVAELAYSYWASRGFQGGSPEEDWLRAEVELQSR